MGLFSSTCRKANSIWLGIICCLFGAASAQGQLQAPSSPPVIKSIHVEYSGPATVSKERILAQMRSKVGEPYSNPVVEQDIKNLYKTGAILNVRIFATPQQDGVDVTVAVQTRSVVREIVVDGAHAIGPKKFGKKSALSSASRWTKKSWRNHARRSSIVTAPMASMR